MTLPVKNDLNWECGFITPDGDFYGCLFYQHENLWALLQPELKFDDWGDLNWLRISLYADRMDRAVFWRGSPKPPTQAQLDRVWEWAVHNGHVKECQKFIASMQVLYRV